MTRPALFVVKATITPELEAAFNHWAPHGPVAEAAQVPAVSGCGATPRCRSRATTPAPSRGRQLGLLRVRFRGVAAGLRPGRTRCGGVMTPDYNGRFGGAGARARLAYRQIYP